MSKIISFATRKGGSGKTTVTCLVANALSSAPFNRRVLVIDCDEQQSIIRRRLADQRTRDDVPPYKVEYKSLAELQRDIVDLDKTHDFIFLDLPGRLDSTRADDRHEIANFLHHVDHLFIPFVPGNYATESTLDYLRAALRIRQQRSESPRVLDVVGFVNLFEGRTLDDRFLMDEINDLRAVVNVRFMESKLHRFALFRNVDTFTTYYAPGSPDKAQANFSAFLDELLKTIK